MEGGLNRKPPAPAPDAGGGHRVRFLPAGLEVAVPAGATLLEAAAAAGVYVASTCGGDGTCGKCRVSLRRGRVRLEGQGEVSAPAEVLACRAQAAGDLEVALAAQAAPAAASSAAAAGEAEGAGPALVEKFFLPPPAGRREPGLSELEELELQLARRLGARPRLADLEVLRRLRPAPPAAGWTATVARLPGEPPLLLEFERGEAAGRQFGLAVDVGTTTVVASLVDLAGRRILATAARFNSQAGHGEDYIRRIMHAEEHDALGELQRLVAEDLRLLTAEVCAAAGVDPGEIAALVPAGNTAMIHFLLGLEPGGLRREPYVCLARQPPVCRAPAAGLAFLPRAWLFPLPAAGAYVGSDITAGVRVAGLERESEPALFIDLGTNGEVVLGNRDFLFCCSASAGPAFEGSGIACGMRAGPGAIEAVKLEGDAVRCRTLGHQPPLGLCGSGLIDLAAALFAAGLVERQGRFNSRARHPALRREEGETRFVVAPAAAGRREIYLGEADLQNLLRAKAAVYAAVALLARRVEVPLARLGRVFLAGGFGSTLNPARAAALGLIPDLPPEKVQFLGNTSLAGARRALFSAAEYGAIRETAARMTYLDLMGDNAFMDEFVKALFIPHTNLELFPSARREAGGGS